MKKKFIHLTITSIAFSSLLGMTSCQDDPVIDESPVPTTGISTKAVPTPYFNWETVDFMPTPSGQALIDLPWHGQGALTYMYQTDILNDIKASDGWELLYTKFNANSTSPIENPYLILYNKYRGIMRVYFYLTSSNIVTSSYLQDEISVITNKSTSILNFLGEDFVDATNNTKSYIQMQPQPANGTPPLASNRWYMMQYELAYDSKINTFNYNDIQFNWNLSYHDITTFEFSGESVGTLAGTIGASSNKTSSSLKDIVNTTNTGILAGIGSDFFEKNSTTDKTTYPTGNKLGIPSHIYENLKNGMNAALSAATGNLPGATVKLLSAIVGGSSGGPTPISLNLKTKMKLTGTGSSSGAIPSTPITFWIPATINIDQAPNYIPYYNKPLGVINFTGKPSINIQCERYNYDITVDDGGYVETLTGHTDTYKFPKTFDFSNYLVINPEVKKIASVKIERQDLAVLVRNHSISGSSDDYSNTLINPETIVSSQDPISSVSGMSPKIVGVRFTIRITPFNGSPSSVILKTFKLNDIINTVNIN